MGTEEEDKDGSFSRRGFKMQSEKAKEELLAKKKKKISYKEVKLKVNVFNFDLISILY